MYQVHRKRVFTFVTPYYYCILYALITSNSFTIVVSLQIAIYLFFFLSWGRVKINQGLIVTDLLWTSWSMRWSHVSPQMDWESSKSSAVCVKCCPCTVGSVCVLLVLHLCVFAVGLARLHLPDLHTHTHTLQIIALASFSHSHCSKKNNLTVISKIVSGLQLKSLAGHLYVSNGVITEVALHPASNREHVMGQLFLKHLFLCVTFRHAGVNWDRAGRDPVNQVCFVIRWVF